MKAIYFTLFSVLFLSGTHFKVEAKDEIAPLKNEISSKIYELRGSVSPEKVLPLRTYIIQKIEENEPIFIKGNELAKN